MANQEHGAILKQGVEVWNKWREENLKTSIDLSEADLSHIELPRVDFAPSRQDEEPIDSIPVHSEKAVELVEVKFFSANLQSADFCQANLMNTDFTGAYLSRANFFNANLSNANFTYANLVGTNFTRANLTGANLTGTDLTWANFSGATLSNINLDKATMGSTTFVETDLSTAKGLDTTDHYAPSGIDIYTILRSQRTVSEVFFRDIGVPESLMTYARSLVSNPIVYYTCFISYSSKDQKFADRLYADLQAKGVRCWFAPHDMKIGDKIRPRIDESIRLYDKLLLILSRDSVTSQWVEHEVETAIGKELEGVPNVLFPIRLDGAVMESKTGWASHIRLTRHIGDFTNWKNHDAYVKAFDRLLRDLKAGE